MPSSSSGDSSDHTVGHRELIELEAHYKDSVMRGWRYFQTSFADDGMACVNCHLSHEQMAGWAGAYPKVQLFDGSPYAVKSLHRVVQEALKRHTDLSEAECEKKADDLVSYISWWGDGQEVTPGLSRDQAPAYDDQRELDQSVERGRALFMRTDPPSCSRCHISGSGNAADGKSTLKNSFLRFPRYVKKSEKVLSMHSFLLRHPTDKDLVMDEDEVTDIQAHLAGLASGRILKPGGE